MADVLAAVSDRIKRVLEPPAEGLVAAFFAPTRPFAGHTFTDVGVNERDTINADDLLAVSLLDVPLRPPGVRHVLGRLRPRISELLSELSPVRNLWEATASDLQVGEELYRTIRVRNIAGPVQTGKLLARKRPRLLPVVDKHVVAALQAPEGQYWTTLRDALARDQLWRLVDQGLRGSLSTDVSTLRLLDAAIWMRRSNSDNARKVQREFGLSLPERSPRRR